MFSINSYPVSNKVEGCSFQTVKFSFSQVWGSNIDWLAICCFKVSLSYRPFKTGKVKETAKCFDIIGHVAWIISSQRFPHKATDTFLNMDNMENWIAETSRWMRRDTIKAEGGSVCVIICQLTQRRLRGHLMFFLEHSTHTWTLKPDNLCWVCTSYTLMHTSIDTHACAHTLSNCVNCVAYNGSFLLNSQQAKMSLKQYSNQ